GFAQHPRDLAIVLRSGYSPGRHARASISPTPREVGGSDRESTSVRASSRRVGIRASCSMMNSASLECFGAGCWNGRTKSSGMRRVGEGMVDKTLAWEGVLGSLLVGAREGGRGRWGAPRGAVGLGEFGAAPGVRLPGCRIVPFLSRAPRHSAETTRT